MLLAKAVGTLAAWRTASTRPDARSQNHRPQGERNRCTHCHRRPQRRAPRPPVNHNGAGNLARNGLLTPPANDWRAFSSSARGERVQVRDGCGVQGSSFHLSNRYSAALRERNGRSERKYSWRNRIGECDPARSERIRARSGETCAALPSTSARQREKGSRSVGCNPPDNRCAAHCLRRR